MKIIMNCKTDCDIKAHKTYLGYANSKFDNNENKISDCEQTKTKTMKYGNMLPTTKFILRLYVLPTGVLVGMGGALPPLPPINFKHGISKNRYYMCSDNTHEITLDHEFIMKKLRVRKCKNFQSSLARTQKLYCAVVLRRTGLTVSFPKSPATPARDHGGAPTAT